MAVVWVLLCVVRSASIRVKMSVFGFPTVREDNVFDRQIESRCAYDFLNSGAPGGRCDSRVSTEKVSHVFNMASIGPVRTAAQAI